MEKSSKDNGNFFEDPNNWKSLGFFNAEEYLIYIFKKTEKITAALYLVSGLLKDEEPLKWELRDHGMELLSASFIASSSVPGDKNIVIQSIFSVALETMSILNVARVSNLISDMNYKLLMREMDNVVGMLRDRLAQNAENAGYILSETFFNNPDLFSSGFKSVPMKQSSTVTHSGIKTTSGTSDTTSNSVKKKERQDAILALLRTRDHLTIKDFSVVIAECSEKTIQRELLDLVAKGLIQKEGERRWSRYSLKAQ